MALNAQRKRLLEKLKSNPVDLARRIGFKLLGPLHNKWIIDMVYGTGDKTLQAHRGSYKTTCVAFALTLIIILFPMQKTLFCRKTDTDVKEIIAQVKKMLENPIMQHIVHILWGVNLEFTKCTEVEISTNLCANDPRGTSQLLGIGTKSSLTGKHYERIFTDDIVNKDDRLSKAEREKTKLFYQELQNIKNRDWRARIYNTGTPWHKEDAFTIMPNAEKYDCYSTGLIPNDLLQSIREKMTASLFAANYELKHIASDLVLFLNPTLNGDPANVMHGESHIDASYGGEDGSAFTIVKKKSGKYYVFGKLRHQHIDDCEDEFIGYHNHFLCNRLSCEKNGDKGYLAKDLRKKGIMVRNYSENQNKYAKIASWLKAVWRDVIFVEGTDQEYIDQILDYNIDADHDDAPDSLASIIRDIWKKDNNDNEEDLRLIEDMYLAYL